MKGKRIISLLAAVSLMMSAAEAATWVKVSSWAYTSVSNFKKENLLPESFEDVTDYTRNITRLRFAELVYSVMSKTNCFPFEDDGLEYTDTFNHAARVLGDSGIMSGEETGTHRESLGEGMGTMMRLEYSFFPDRLLTREEMAAVVYRAVKRDCAYLLTELGEDDEYLGSRPTDYYDISKWARVSVSRLKELGMVYGMEDGSFMPKQNLTIEQAMVVLYALYNKIPTASEADGANLHSDIEQRVQWYPCGIEETKKNDMLYIKNGGKVLMEFEADIYTNIYCEITNGATYAAAQNVYGKTDVYNADDKELMFKIPYPVYELNQEYIVTKSSSRGPMTFGVTGYDGEEILPPEYSLAEINEIKENGWIIPVEEPQEASGWVYYIDMDDGYHLYRIDSNGNNKQLISDMHVDDMEYINGRLYCYALSEESGVNELRLYCMNLDGSNTRLLFDNYVSLLGGGYMEYRIDENDIDGFSGMDRYDNMGGDIEALSSRTAYAPRSCYDDKGIYCMEHDQSAHREGNNKIWRVEITDTEIKKEEITERHDVYSTQYKNERLYFKDCTDVPWGVSSYEWPCALYYFDGEKTVKVSGDLQVLNYGFTGDRLVMQTGEDLDNTTAYIADMDGNNAHIYTELEAAKEKAAGKKSHIYTYIFESMSDDEYTVYEVENTSNGDSTVYCRNKDGIEAEVGGVIGSPDARIGNTLYFTRDAKTAEKEDTELVAFDMETGRQRVVANGIQTMYRLTNARSSRFLTYTDYSFNYWRYNGVTGELSEIFPCKELHTQGKLQCVLKLQDGLYKVDTDGNYSRLSDVNAAYNYMYIEKGADKTVRFELF